MKYSTALFGLIGASALAVSPAPAAQNDRADLWFRPQEFTLDLFGSASVSQRTLDHLSWDRIDDDARLGVGLGGNYFFDRYVGLGADAYSENPAHSFVDNTSGNLIIRFPFDRAHLAPYIYGGGGYQFDPGDLWFGQAGGGLEFRFNRTVGIFTDFRYVFTDGTENFGVGRAGLRLGF